MSSQPSDLILAEYQAGKLAFERGRYRRSLQHFETICEQIEKNSRLGGEVQTWLVTTYQALGQQESAIALCQKLVRHPSYETRKQSRRLLEILQAPQLSSNTKGFIEFPDMSQLEEGENQDLVRVTSKPTSTKRSTPPPVTTEPIDLTQVNTQDNQFLWVALLGIGLILGSLWLLS